MVKPQRLKMKLLIVTILLIGVSFFNSCTRTANSSGGPNQLDLSSSGNFALGLDKFYGMNGCRVVGGSNHIFESTNRIYLSAINSVYRFFSNGEIDNIWGQQGIANAALLQSLLETTEPIELLLVDSSERLMIGSSTRLCRVHANLTLDTSFQSASGLSAGCLATTAQSGNRQIAQLIQDSDSNYWLVRLTSNRIVIEGFGSSGTSLGIFDLGQKSLTSFGFSLRDVGYSKNQIHIIYNTLDNMNRENTGWLTFDTRTNLQTLRIEDSSLRNIRIDSQGRWTLTEFDPSAMTGTIEIDTELPRTNLGVIATDIQSAPMKLGGSILLTGYRRASATSTGISVIRLDNLGSSVGIFNAGLDLGLPSKCDDTSLCRAKFIDINNQGPLSFILVSGSDEVSLLCRFNTP